MMGRKNTKMQGRRFYKRALVLSLAVYVASLAVIIFGAGNETVLYVGFALLAVGSIALAKTFVDGLISISTGLRAAVILALLGIIGYAIWVDISPTL